MSPCLSQCLPTSSCGGFRMMTFGGPRMGFIMSIPVSLVGEEYIDLTTDLFKRIHFFLENSLGELLNSKIRFDFKEAPALICIGIAFFLHPQFTHFHVFPLSVTRSAVSKRNTIPLSVFIWCADSAAQAQRKRGRERDRRNKKGERTVRPTSEEQEFSLSAQSLCRVCCFWRSVRRIHSYTTSWCRRNVWHFCTYCTCDYLPASGKRECTCLRKVSRKKPPYLLWTPLECGDKMLLQ